MSDVMMLHGAEPREILQTAIEKKVPAIMSYLSNGKWHVAKILLTTLGANRLDVHILLIKKPHPMNIRVDQPVGISLKHGYGKFIFETKVVALEPSLDTTSGGIVVLAVPDSIEIVQRRSYFRVDVPRSLKVNVLVWHRSRRESKVVNCSQHSIGDCWQGRLVDISAGGAQVALDAGEKPDFRKGQFIGLTFTPLPYEKPLMFNAQIRNILPTADSKSICLGMQIVGLEASLQGRQVLSRLVGVVERYYQINQSSAKQPVSARPSLDGQDMHPAPIEAQLRRCKPGA
jgi:hypothetical protein